MWFYAFALLEGSYSNAKSYSDKKILGLSIIHQNVNFNLQNWTYSTRLL